MPAVTMPTAINEIVRGKMFARNARRSVGSSSGGDSSPALPPTGFALALANR